MRTFINADAADVIRTLNPKEQEHIINLINGLKLNLERIPSKGESFSFHIADYVLIAEVSDVMTRYCESGNRNFKSKLWGITYEVFIGSIEIVQHLKSKTKAVGETYDAFLEIKLSNPAFELRVRTVNALTCADIITVSDLLARNANELSQIRNIGKSAIDELTSFLSDYGLSLQK